MISFRNILYFSFSLILAIFVFSSGLSAQNKKGQMKKGDKHFNRLAYSAAVKHYLKYANANPGTHPVEVKLGDSYRLMNDPKQAEAWYAEAVSASPDIVRFHYATMLQQNEKFDEAAVQFNEYLKRDPGNKVADVRYRSCMEYKKFYEQKNRFTVEDAGINTAGADFCPVPFGTDKIVLSSNRQQQGWLFAWLNNSFLDLYISDYTPGVLKLDHVVKMKGQINSQFHEATASFTPSGDTIYFTRNNFYKGKVQHDQEGTLLLQTYRAVMKGKGWRNIREMSFNNDEYSTGHPALFDNGSRMIIASDMPGSIGGTDLYLLEKQGSEWGTPVNMGPGINTAGNEMFPWVDAEGTLFFASNGHEGLGGLDVFMSKKTGGFWSQPENLGSPINTPVDDFGLVLVDDGTRGYFSSNRAGGIGDDDIYSFIVKKEVIARVVDAVTKQPIEGAVTKSYLDGEPKGHAQTDKNGEEKLYTEGNYDYLLDTQKDGYEPKQMVITPSNHDPFDPYLVTIELTRETICNPTAYLDGAILNNNEPLPSGTKIKIREKETEVVIQPGLTFGYDLEIGKEYIVSVETDNMPPKEYEVNAKDAKDRDTLDLLVDFIPTKADIGKVFYIIYYNFDKHDIRTDASNELDDMVAYMKKYPTIKVEMGSHTDARGTKEYNITLSHNRARDAQAYIIAHGIAADRITYKYFGETQLTNDCGDNHLDCTEEAHQLNRRTEFKLIGM